MGFWLLGLFWSVCWGCSAVGIFIVVLLQPGIAKGLFELTEWRLQIDRLFAVVSCCGVAQVVRGVLFSVCILN